MDYSEKWGTDVDEAVKLALIDLKLSKDEVEITIIEEPSKGFFGLGSKLAKVKVEKKKAEKSKVEKDKKAFEPAKVQPVQKTGETKPNKPQTGEAPKTVIIGEPEEDLTIVEEHATLTFLKETTQKMGLALDITAKEGKEALYISISGKDSGTIIGKRGQTLDALQYLTSLVANKGETKHQRVIVDAEQYRAKRERTLEQLAKRLADKVARSKRSVRLEPMNPYERKVIHSTLQKDARVSTKSEGQEPHRRVVIETKI